ncbi:hypothetical protein BC351_02915 [Paenibacillus ferrarius]|uniref:Uncharacterized protein n=1 Tax=Paenibacillus ferrarius TaxID=1469647 RepID=A0A1V4HJL6_9BACL|nr:hypothetical protein [Paenibacillus ferrarius]OPH57495.1 hypothetical protein BC351_02915 [Paenibacillus ferrarius]
MTISTIEQAMQSQAASISQITLSVLGLIEGLLLRYSQASDTEKISITQDTYIMISSSIDAHYFHQRKYQRLSSTVTNRLLVPSWGYVDEISELIMKLRLLILQKEIRSSLDCIRHLDELFKIYFVDKSLQRMETSTEIVSKAEEETAIQSQKPSNRPKRLANKHAAPPLLFIEASEKSISSPKTLRED